MIWLLLDAKTFSGIEKHVEVMVESLNKQGRAAQIVLLTPFENHPFHARLLARNIPHLVLEGGFKGLLKGIKLHQPTLIHTHGYKGGIFGRIAARLLRVKVVSTFHAGERGAFPVSLYQMIDEKLAFLSHTNFAVSSQIQQRVPSSIVLKNAIEVPAPTRHSLPPVVAFVGRLSHEKAPDVFCAIAQKMQNMGLEFVIYGDGVMRQELEHEYQKYVTFKGFTDTMEHEWAKIGLLLMPSRAEGLPMAALEAMANGVPVCASRVGGLPSLVEGTGWLFESEDVSGACAAIAQWQVCDKQLSIISNHNKINENYNINKEINIITQYYDKLTK